MNPADLPRDEKGRYYHIRVRRGTLPQTFLMCADPRRAERIAKRLDSPERKGDKRGYLTFTGTYNSVLLTIIGTGIGAPATAIAIVEAANCQKNATFIRVGTCGALQRHVALGDLVITKRVVREENTSENYGPPGIEVSGHTDLLMPGETQLRKFVPLFMRVSPVRCWIFLQVRDGYYEGFPDGGYREG